MPTSSQAIPTATGTTNSSSAFDITIPQGQLPIQPNITPGWAVSGALLILTGIICALVGIRKRWLHTFLTTGFLASLGTTVLILYVANLPVSDAVQGAYVVAAGCTGLIVGGLAIIFQDLAEGLACLLAGFCFSIWLLTLRSGGLIQHSGGKTAFIILLSLATFCLYFTRWTRTYGLIAAISFSGAAATTLGIDCFTRAGLKEFWAYIWDLNDDIFPYGTVTYPLTRGIQAEIAATMILFAAGIVSQLKLWRLVRHKRDSDLAGHASDLEEEEEKTARQLEEARARDLREWEKRYGDGKIRQVPSSEDSGLGDMDSEKRVRHSQRSISAVTTTRSRSATETDSGMGNPDRPFERAATPLSLAQATAAAMACSPTRNLQGAIRDSDDGTSSESSGAPGSPTFDKKESEVRGPDTRRVVSSVVPIATPTSQFSSDSGSGPEPQPSRPMEGQAGGNEPVSAGVENEKIGPGQTPQYRSTTLIRKLSNGSAKLFRNLSQRASQREAEINQLAGESHEELIAATWKVRNDSESVAVNFDDLESVSDKKSIEDAQVVGTQIPGSEAQRKEEADKTEAIVKPAEETTNKALSEDESDQTDRPQAQQESGIPSTSKGYAVMFNEPYEYHGEKKNDQPVETDVPASMGGSKPSGTPQSDESSGGSPLKDDLAQELLPVAMYYRTNEWAKHLDTADCLEEPVAPQPIDDSTETDSGLPTEKPAPVDIVGLQQTATSASVPRAIPRTTSWVTSYLDQQQRSVQRSSSGPLLQRYPEGGNHVPEFAPKPEPVVTRASPYRSASETLKGLTSRLHAEPIAEEGGVQAPWPSQHRTPSTLIDTREALLRSKSLGPLFNAEAMDALHNGSPAAQSHNAGSPPVDIDDIPLSQRRKIIRQSSLTYDLKNNRSRDMLRDSNNPSPKLNPQSWNTPTSPIARPVRQASNTPPTPDAVRQAKLANFRSSVAADLRASSSRNALNNIATHITSPPLSTSPSQQPVAVFDPYSFGHVMIQPQQLHPGMGRRSSTQRNTYGYQSQQQQQQDPLAAAGFAIESQQQQRRSSVPTPPPTQMQVAQAHRAHRAHRDAMRRLQANAKAE
ncbi:hypothetical protein B0T20DRAFT_482846 [Sordaria brevicollis]|uniref:TM7S3/TM198-like domain-containing protein n=1 Tax=Sordaria brevicollis TaxID=83679 RepID=A0AAE0P294_SORBR|nr:hypothetical protein B0T20DRAFT_482846 [Sordaria brevicollis]